MELPKSGFFSTVFSALLRPYLRRLDKPALPKYRGKLSLAGLKNPVNVRWDSFAVPHVSAANEPDVFFAQGFLHAQERLWQMELSRRFLSGRMAEAHKAMDRLLQLDPALRLSNLNQLFPIRRVEDFARWEEGMRRAGLPE